MSTEQANRVLSRQMRVLAGFAGSVLMAAGAVAVYVTDNQAGTVALLLIGLTLVLPALAGVMPQRIVWGDKEVDWGPFSDFMQDVVAEADEEQRATLVGDEGSERLPPPARSAVSNAMIRAIAYEKAVAGAAPSGTTIQIGRIGDYGFDFLVAGPSGKRLGVEVKVYSRPLPAAAAHQVVEAMQRAPIAPDEVLLVSATEPTASARQILADAGIHVAVAPDRSDLPSVTRTMAQLLDIPDS